MLVRFWSWESDLVDGLVDLLALFSLFVDAMVLFGIYLVTKVLAQKRIIRHCNDAFVGGCQLGPFVGLPRLVLTNLDNELAILATLRPNLSKLSRNFPRLSSRYFTCLCLSWA